jgi:hemolysin III
MAGLAQPLDARLGVSGQRGSSSLSSSDSDTSAASSASRPELRGGAHSSRPRLLVTGEPLIATLQWYKPPRRPYTRRELLADRVVNFLGAGLSWLGVCSLVIMSMAAGDPLSKTAGYLAFGVGLVAMLNLSAFYHLLCWDWGRAEALFSLDKIGINSMIMGAYTPVCLQVDAHWTLAFVYVLGCIGLVAQVPHLCGLRCKEGEDSSTWTWGAKLDLVRYVIMGWAVVAIAPVVYRSLPMLAVLTCILGGVIYTTGIVFFVSERLEFHLAIWHGFVLIASLCFYLVNAIFLVGKDYGPR